MSECPICLDDYVASPSHSNGPVVGKCGHSFCRGCVQKLHVAACETFNPRIRNLGCPYCKGEKAFRSDQLVPNWALIHMIEFSNEANEKDKQIEALERKNCELAGRLECADKTTTKLNAKLQAKCAELEQKDGEALELIVELKTELRTKDAQSKRQCSELEKKGAELKATCVLSSIQLKAKDATIKTLRSDLKAKRIELMKKSVTLKLTEAKLRDDLKAKCTELKKKGVALKLTTAKFRDESKATHAELKQKDLELQTLKALLEGKDGTKRVKSADTTASLSEKPEIIDLCSSDDDDDKALKIVEVSDEEAAKIQMAADLELQRHRQSRRYAEPHVPEKRQWITATATSIGKKQKSLVCCHTVAANSQLVGSVFPPVLQHQLPPPPAQQMRTAQWLPQQMQPQQQTMMQTLAQQGHRHTVPANSQLVGSVFHPVLQHQLPPPPAQQMRTAQWLPQQMLPVPQQQTMTQSLNQQGWVSKDYSTKYRY